MRHRFECENCKRRFSSCRPNARFCCVQCRCKMEKKTPRYVPCEWCGKSVCQYGRNRSPRFCSTACIGHARVGKFLPSGGKKACVCAHCQREFSTYIHKGLSGKYCSQQCAWSDRKGKATPRRGNITMHGGYRCINAPDGSGRISEHRWIIQQHIGRKLDPKEHVHHINGDRADNRIENLEIISAIRI
jgi:hypothetical protein